MSKRQARTLGNLGTTVSIGVAQQIRKLARAHSGFAIIMIAVLRQYVGGIMD